MIDKTNDKCPIQVARTLMVNEPLPGEVPLPLPVQVHAVGGFLTRKVECFRCHVKTASISSVRTVGMT